MRHNTKVVHLSILRCLFHAIAFACWAASIGSVVAIAQDYPPVRISDSSGWGRNIQRTMRLLATSAEEKRNTVRILFYGQSITEQNWSKLVEEDLRKRFPHANLIVENRALGGFSSQLLVKTAETDLYPFQPDLLIFHVYGAHDKYEDIIRRTREYTTAEILIQNDHVTKPDDFTEETDAAQLLPDGKHWDAFMNHNHLPAMAQKYHAELCDQRRLWKAYLLENKLEPKRLLRDAVHLNEHGEWLMAECVKWTAEARFLDEFRSPVESDLATEAVVTIAQVLSNSKHLLEVVCELPSTIHSIRVYGSVNPR